MKIKENLHMQIDTLKGAASAEYSRGVKDGAKAQRAEPMKVRLDTVAWVEKSSLPDLQGTEPTWTAAWNSPTGRNPVALVTLESAQQAVAAAIKKELE